MVLLAVAMSMAPTSRLHAQLITLALNRLLMPFKSAVKPPYSRMSAQMALTSTATIVVSNMPAAPEPMLASRSVAAVAPVATMMREPERMPSRSTTNTFTPTMPPTSTMRHGTSDQVVVMAHGAVDVRAQRQRQDDGERRQGGRHGYLEVLAELVLHLAALALARRDGGVGDERQVVAEHRAAHDAGYAQRQVEA